MESLKKILKNILFPHIVLAWLFIPVAIILLVYAMVYSKETSAVAIVSYILSAYTLTIWCLKIPRIINFFKCLRRENQYAKRWSEDVSLRVNISLYKSLFLNVAYAIFQLCLGIYHASFWYCSMSIYYIFLALMRFFLVRHTRKHKPGEKPKKEFEKYRLCGIMFLLVNMALTVMIFFMVYFNRTFIHHEITTIAMAAYTFTAFIMAIINLVKYHKYNSPIYVATKTISLTAACVSMLTLTATMLTTFGDETSDGMFRQIMLGTLGGIVSIYIIIMAVYMIVYSSKEIKKLKVL